MMRIGELAAATGETVKTLRFWEEQNLLEADRADNGYRYFAARMKERASFIRRAEALGFTLAEVRGILELREEGLQPCDEVRVRLRDHLDAIRHRLRALRTLEGELEATLRRAEGDPDPVCEDGCVYLASNRIDG